MAHGVVQPVHDGLQVGRRRDKRRGEQNMITMLAVDRAPHGVHHEALVHGRRLDLGVYLSIGLKPLLGASVLHQFKAPKETPSTNIAHVGVVAKRLRQQLLQHDRVLLHMRQKLIAGNDLLHSERCCTRHGMPQISVAMLKKPAA